MQISADKLIVKVHGVYQSKLNINNFIYFWKLIVPKGLSNRNEYKYAYIEEWASKKLEGTVDWRKKGVQNIVPILCHSSINQSYFITNDHSIPIASQQNGHLMIRSMPIKCQILNKQETRLTENEKALK